MARYHQTRIINFIVVKSGDYSGVCSVGKRRNSNRNAYRMEVGTRHHIEQKEADNLADDAAAKRQVNPGRCPGAPERQRQEQVAADERRDRHYDAANFRI